MKTLIYVIQISFVIFAVGLYGILVLAQAYIAWRWVREKRYQKVYKNITNIIQKTTTIWRTK